MFSIDGNKCNKYPAINVKYFSHWTAHKTLIRAESLRVIFLTKEKQHFWLAYSGTTYWKMLSRFHFAQQGTFHTMWKLNKAFILPYKNFWSTNIFHCLQIWPDCLNISKARASPLIHCSRIGKSASHGELQLLVWVRSRNASRPIQDVQELLIIIVSQTLNELKRKPNKLLNLNPIITGSVTHKSGTWSLC